MSPYRPDELRREAERQLAARDSQIATLEHADLVSLAHELAVHQIELEIQNEELRQTRTLAEEARDRYLDLYDFAPVGYFTLDEHSRIVEANLTGCRLLKAERQDLLRTRFTQFILGEEAERFYFHRKLALEGGVRQTCELKMQGANGTAFDARLESIRAGEGRLRVAVIDVTERKRAQEESRSQQRLLQTVLNTVPVGVIVSDAEGNFAYANPHVSRIFGQQASGSAFGPAPNTYQVLKPDHTPFPGEELPLVRAVRDEKDVMGVEMLIRRADGNEVAVLADCAPVRDTLGHVTGAVASIIDITARKRAEGALRELTRTLESKVVQRTAELEHRAHQLQKLTLELSLSEDRERKRIAQILHDDLQQVLAAAKFHLGVLKNRAAQDPSQQAIAATIDQMLQDAIAKSRSLSHELSPAAVHHNDLAAILRWLASQMQAKHGLTVHVKAPEEMRLQSEAIAIFLVRTVQELLFNVVKHAGVTEARIRTHRRGRYISLTVSDRGRGFDSHEQSETGGFGLFSIRERAELLGGSMKIRSRPGEGSTLRIIVPAQEAYPSSE